MTTSVLEKLSADFWDNALCSGIGAEAFYPDSDVYSEVIALCAECPIRRQCAEYAIAHERYGYWGGLSARARQRIRSKREIKLAPPVGGFDFAELMRQRAREKAAC